MLAVPQEPGEAERARPQASVASPGPPLPLAVEKSLRPVAVPSRVPERVPEQTAPPDTRWEWERVRAGAPDEEGPDEDGPETGRTSRPADDPVPPDTAVNGATNNATNDAMRPAADAPPGMDAVSTENSVLLVPQEVPADEVSQLLPIPDSAAPALVNLPAKQYFVSEAEVNLRAGPSTRYRVIARLAAGVPVILLDDEDVSWVRVRVVGEVGDTGRTGYMSRRYLSETPVGG